MSNLLEYKDCFGSIAYSAEDRVFFGKIEFINDLVTFEAVTVDSLEKEFRNALDHYIETCNKIGRKPQKTFKGRLNIRIPRELHQKASVAAMKRNVSLNKLIESAISRGIATY